MTMKLRAGLILLTLLCFQPFSAAAFTPLDEELSAMLRKNYGPMTSWEAEMRFPEYPDVVARLWYARGKWRQQWTAGDTATAVGVGGNVVADCTADGFPLSPLFVWMVPQPVETWKSWGVDNATSSYGFCDGQPCYMLGAYPGDEASPAVHLNNEDMAPLLIRYPGPEGPITLTFSDYRMMGGFQVPQKVVAAMGALVLEGAVKWIAVNQAEGEQLYAREALDGTPCATPPAPFTILRDHFRYPQTR